MPPPYPQATDNLAQLAVIKASEVHLGDVKPLARE